MINPKPLAIDLFCGLGGWTEGLLAEGYNVVGFDIERHRYGEHHYPAQLVIQDVLTLHGSQFRDAALIVASPPCQEYSYMAMPWKLAKAKAAAIRADTSGQELANLNRLFDACFRIQVQASLAARRHIPMVVENVRGAIPWVGRSRWNYGSFYLWGDVPALMPETFGGAKIGGGIPGRTGFPNDRLSDAGVKAHRDSGAGWLDTGPSATKVPGFRFDGSKRSFQEAAVAAVLGIKNSGGSWFAVGPRGGVGEQNNGRDGIKHHGSGAVWFDTGPASFSSKSNSRKAASAMIAKIPLPLSRHVAAMFRPPT